jgi:3-deoxy-D-manno-octulosonic-acid transferase
MAPASLWLYRVLTRLLLPIVLPVMWVADRLRAKQRPGVVERLARRLPDVEAGGIWLQAVSVGEVEVARRLLEELDKRGESVPLLLSATTATGLALARRSMADRLPVIPCPLDLSAAVSRVLEHARPGLVVLVETELWPELIHQTRQRGIRLAVVNGRISPDAFGRYRRVRALLAPLIDPIDLVLAREGADAERFAELGVRQEKIQVLGNLKYDLQRDTEPLPWSSTARELAAGRPIVVAGSTMAGEETLLLDAVAELGSRGLEPFMVLAPRHPERFDEVAELIQNRGIRSLRRSRLATPTEGVDLLLLDTIGELARAYQLASMAFVGGSLVATGGHNPLEPAVWGVPVLTGPEVFNFQEVYDEITAAGGARSVRDSKELVAALGNWLEDPEAARRAGESGLQVVEANRGATSRTIDALLELKRRED